MAWGVIRLAICALILLGVSMPSVAAVAKAEFAVEYISDNERIDAGPVIQQAVKEPCCKHLHGVSAFCFGDATPAGFASAPSAALVRPPPWPGETSRLKTGEPAPMLRPPIS